MKCDDCRVSNEKLYLFRCEIIHLGELELTLSSDIPILTKKWVCYECLEICKYYESRLIKRRNELLEKHKTNLQAKRSLLYYQVRKGNK